MHFCGRVLSRGGAVEPVMRMLAEEAGLKPINKVRPDIGIPVLYQ